MCRVADLQVDGVPVSRRTIGSFTLRTMRRAHPNYPIEALLPDHLLLPFLSVSGIWDPTRGQLTQRADYTPRVSLIHTQISTSRFNNVVRNRLVRAYYLSNLPISYSPIPKPAYPFSLLELS